MEDAMKLADDLYDLNQSRKAMTEQGKEQAIQSIEENNLGKDPSVGSVSSRLS